VGVDCPKTVKDLSENLKLNMLSRSVYNKVGNKIRIYNCLKKFGVIPAFQIIRNKKDIFLFLKKRKFPIILKSSDGRGSRGVFLLKNRKELMSRIQLFKNKFYNKNFILQEYIDGKQFSAESLLFKKKHTILISSRNYNTFRFLNPSIIENGGTLNPKISKKLRNKIVLEMKKISEFLGIVNGPFKADLVVRNNKIFFLEVAIRFGGGYVASRCSHHLVGFNFLKEYLKILMKKKVSIKKKFKIKNCITNRTIIAKKEGILNSIKINIPKNLKKNLLHLTSNKKQGDYVRPPMSHSDRVIFFSVKANNSTISDRIARKISNHIKLEIL